MSTYDTYQNNQVYQLIRRNAGSKMIREAEQMIVYDIINELLSDEMVYTAREHMRHFYMEYPTLATESPSTLLNMSDLAQIDFKELQELPSIYLEMLRSLSWANETTVNFINEKIEAVIKTTFRPRLTDAVDNISAFEYVYTKWYQESEAMIHKSTNLLLGTTFDDEISLEFSRLEKERYKRVESTAALKKHNTLTGLYDRPEAQRYYGNEDCQGGSSGFDDDEM